MPIEILVLSLGLSRTEICLVAFHQGLDVVLLSLITLTKNPLQLVCSENLIVSDIWFGWQTPLRTPSLPLDRLGKGYRHSDSSGQLGF